MIESSAIHHRADPRADRSLPDPHQDSYAKTVLGFWIYLMTDCVLFATLFATYAVLHGNTFGGPGSQELFSLSQPFVETVILLFSSAACGLAVIAAQAEQRSKAIGWLLVTGLLGATFLALELHEFAHLVNEGHNWQSSAFLSAFFTLVGAHGLHITVGMLWLLVMVGQLAAEGVTQGTFRRLSLFSIYWHFLDLVWIFIFTFVYLLGVI
jgi:cytochrome o ubiquinol oxidase subunit 3